MWLRHEIGAACDGDNDVGDDDDNDGDDGVPCRVIENDHHNKQVTTANSLSRSRSQIP